MYHLLREEDDWSFLGDPALRQDFWDPIKYIPLRRNSDDWYLTISGEAREVWEQTGNNNWGQQPYWNSFFLERYMLGFDAHYGKHFRTFVEFKKRPASAQERLLTREAGLGVANHSSHLPTRAFLGTDLGEAFSSVSSGESLSNLLDWRVYWAAVRKGQGHRQPDWVACVR
jgi:hypothetical protein